MPWKWQLLRATLHFASSILALALMLVAMTFSIALFVSVVAGAFFGYLAFDRHITHYAEEDVDVLGCH